MMLLFGISLCSCGVTNDERLNQTWWISGYGSYVNGANYDSTSGLQFQENEEKQSGVLQSFLIENAPFSVGDALVVTNEDKSIVIDAGIKTEEGSFTTNNVYLYNSSQIDVLATGQYDIQLDILKDGYSLTINNGEGTASNLNPVKPTEEITINLYASGDQHGVVEQTIYESKMLPSMPQYVAVLKNEMAQSTGEDVIISNGDLWQGTYASNFNYGKMLNEIIEYVGYSSFTLGNHEFDWGEENIRENKSLTSVPFLGANVVIRDTENLVDYVQPFAIIERSGLKIGIIGVIGKSQLTSITSSQVENVSFLNEEEAVMENSDRLRTEFDCDIVVASFHSGTSSLRSVIKNLGEISENSGERYVDAVFTAHDHSATKGSNNGIPYNNSGNNSRNISHIALTYNQGSVDYVENRLIPTTDLVDVEEDAQTRAIVDKYCSQEIKDKGNEVAGTINEIFSDNNQAPNMMAKAVYDYCVEQGQSDVVLSIVNVARADLLPDEVTYSEILDAFPFFNKTLIIDASGFDLISSASSNYYYAPDPTWEIDANATYKIAVCDYLALHQNSQRIYDYFQMSHPLNIYAEFDRYPCDILFDYMKCFESTILASDYTSINYTFLD